MRKIITKYYSDGIITGYINLKGTLIWCNRFGRPMLGFLSDKKKTTVTKKLNYKSALLLNYAKS